MAIINGIQQAGLNKVVLYENKNITINRPDINKENEVDLIFLLGLIVTIEYDDLPTFERKIETSGNYNELFNDEIQFYARNFDSVSRNIIKRIRENRNGFIAELQFLNGDNFLLQAPVFLNEETKKKVNEGVQKMTMNYRVPTEKDNLIKLNTVIFAYSYIITADNTFLGYATNKPLKSK